MTSHHSHPARRPIPPWTGLLLYSPPASSTELVDAVHCYPNWTMVGSVQGGSTFMDGTRPQAETSESRRDFGFQQSQERKGAGCRIGGCRDPVRHDRHGVRGHRLGLRRRPERKQHGRISQGSAPLHPRQHHGGVWRLRPGMGRRLHRLRVQHHQSRGIQLRRHRRIPRPRTHIPRMPWRHQKRHSTLERSIRQSPRDRNRRDHDARRQLRRSA